MSEELTRREFMERSSRYAAVAGLAAAGRADAQETKSSLQELKDRVPPGERITMGFIGLGGMGTGLLKAFNAHPDVRVAAVCDVYKRHRERAAELVGGGAKTYADFRHVIDRKDLDAVVVATPDHWHALATVRALESGKDVYCEKPLSYSIGEGRAMVRAARDHKRVTQMGTQIHATRNYRRIVEIIRSGMLGDIMKARVWIAGNASPGGIGRPADSDPPAGLDYDMWLGPAPRRPFNPNRFLRHFRLFWDYAGGRLTDMGCHIIDLVHWALGADAPKTITASGSRYVLDDNGETPDTQEVVWEYPPCPPLSRNGFVLVWSHTDASGHGFHGQGLGIMFNGTNGTMVCDYGKHKIFPDGDRLKDVEEPPTKLPPPIDHRREFLNSIKSRKPCSCEFAYGHKLTSVVNMGTIALRTGRKLRWDADNERFIDDADANRYLMREYRSPWKL